MTRADNLPEMVTEPFALSLPHTPRSSYKRCVPVGVKSSDGIVSLRDEDKFMQNERAALWSAALYAKSELFNAKTE